MINCYNLHRCGKAVAEEVDEGPWFVDFTMKVFSKSQDKSVACRRQKSS